MTMGWNRPWAQALSTAAVSAQSHMTAMEWQT